MLRVLGSNKVFCDGLSRRDFVKVCSAAAAAVGLPAWAGEKMADAYTKAGGKVHRMTKDEFDQWLALARDTSWKEFAASSPEAKDLLDALLQAK